VLLNEVLHEFAKAETSRINLIVVHFPSTNGLEQRLDERVDHSQVELRSQKLGESLLKDFNHRCRAAICYLIIRLCEEERNERLENALVSIVAIWRFIKTVNQVFLKFLGKVAKHRGVQSHTRHVGRIIGHYALVCQRADENAHVLSVVGVFGHQPVAFSNAFHVRGSLVDLRQILIEGVLQLDQLLLL